MKLPPKSLIAFYNGRGKLLFDASRRMVDLSDTLMLHWPYASRTIYIGLSTRALRWKVWDEAALSNIENAIREDLNFDYYYVHVSRHSAPRRRPCSTEFVWKLLIRAR